MEIFVIILLFIVAVECFVISMFVLNKINKTTDKLLEMTANFQVALASTRMEKKDEILEKSNEETVKNKRPNVITQEDNLKSAEYSGVLHKFVRDGTKRERPVMVFTYRGNKVFFEYDEAGKPVYLRTKARKDVLEVLEGKKIRNYKLYKVENK